MLTIDLTGKDIILTEGHTSKGNQPKWLLDGDWYKADHMGCETLSEVLTSRLLAHSNIQNYVCYEPVLIRDGDETHIACKSSNFQQRDEMLVPIERLYRAYHGQSLVRKLAGIPDVTEQIRYTVEFVESITHLTGFGSYLSTLLELDAFILNEDRHTNNIAVIRNEATGLYRLCPIFDNGLSFLSDLKDYPLEKDLYQNISKVEAKPFSRDFMLQLEAATNLYGSSLHVDLTHQDIDNLFDGLSECYDEKVIGRARSVLAEQMRKFRYLFCKDFGIWHHKKKVNDNPDSLGR